MKLLLGKIWVKVTHEPIAVWGTVLTAAMGLLALAGISPKIIDVIFLVATALGIPVMRGLVVPGAKLKILAGPSLSVADSVPSVEAAPSFTDAPPESAAPPAQHGKSSVNTDGDPSLADGPPD